LGIKISILPDAAARRGAHFYATSTPRRVFLFRRRAARTGRRAFLSHLFTVLFGVKGMMNFEQIHAGLADHSMIDTSTAQVGEGLNRMAGGPGGLQAGLKMELGHPDLNGMEETGLLQPTVEHAVGYGQVAEGLFKDLPGLKEIIQEDALLSGKTIEFGN
jgi:hypothetical protein